jgi:hypothetical protein
MMQARASTGFDMLSFHELLFTADFWQVVESIATTTAIVVGAFWTYRLFVQKRQRFPRAVTSHTIYSWTLPNSKIFLRVSVRVRNLGDVLVQLRKAKIWVSGMRPTEQVTEIAFEDRSKLERDEELPWPVIAECTWDRGNVEIEPSEEEEINFDFVIDSWQTIQIYSYFQNEIKRRGLVFWKHKEIGWNTTTIHELTPSEEGGKMLAQDRKLPGPTHDRQRPPKERPVTTPPQRGQRPPKQPPPMPPKKGT